MRSEEAVLALYGPLIRDHDLNFGQIGAPELPIPRFGYELLLDLCVRCAAHFRRQPTIIHIDGDAEIIGDIHGNIHDLIRVLAHISSPATCRIVFLGDYVDRGRYSIEVVTLLFALVLAYPENVILLRGNHEFRDVNSIYGFKEEVTARYQGTELFDDVNNAFDNLPLGVVINERYLCVHGGLPKAVTKLEQLDRLDRFKDDASTRDIVTDLVWSDPHEDIGTFQHSLRGRGNFFGELPLHQFLKNSKLETMVRGHECVPQGVTSVMHKQILTVFSSSNYADHSNKAGVARVANGELSAHFLRPLDILVKSGEESYRDHSKMRAKARRYDSLRQTHVVMATQVGRINLRASRSTVGQSCASFGLRTRKATIGSHLSTGAMPPLLPKTSWKSSTAPQGLVTGLYEGDC